MVEIANGQIRLAAKDSKGNYKPGGMTGLIDFSIWDNSASPMIALEDTLPGHVSEASANDIRLTVPRNCYVNGNAGDLLDIELLHTSALTHTTASDAIFLKVKDIYVNAVGVKVAEDRIIHISDRLSQTAAVTAPNGLPENSVNVANIPTPILRFRPEPGHTWVPSGLQVGGITISA